MTTAVALPYGAHIKALAGVDDVASVQTHLVHELSVRTREVSRLRGILVLTGQPGVGKTFATARAAEACAADPARPVEVVWVELASVMRGRQLLADLYPQICGVQADRRATGRQLAALLNVELARIPRLLVVDEAHHVSKEAMLLLRWMWDQRDSDFALVAVGLPSLWNRLAPEMRSRCASHIEVHKIADLEVGPLLRDYHPLLAGSDEDLLRGLNRTRARGEFRWWALFLARAVPYARKLGVDHVTPELARIVVEAMG